MTSVHGAHPEAGRNRRASFSACSRSGSRFRRFTSRNCRPGASSRRSRRPPGSTPRAPARCVWGGARSSSASSASARAYLATRSSVENLEIVFTWSTLIASMLVFATPLMYASLGGIFSERSGVVNIGLEGMMLMGAFWGIWGADKTGYWVTGVLIGMAAGGLLGLLHAFFSVHLRADQIVGGTAINLLAIGITGYAFVQLYGTENIPAGVSEIPRLQMRFLETIPPDTVGNFLYGAFGRLSVMIWIGFCS